jgi:hypothetical protein
MACLLGWNRHDGYPNSGRGKEPGGRSLRLADHAGQGQSKLQSIDHAQLGVLLSEIPHIASDPNVSEPTRQKLADFSANYLEMKSYVDNPRGSYLTYQAQVQRTVR